MLRVRLLSCTPNPDEVIAKAAKLCYSAIGVDDMNISEEECKKFVSMLLGIGHHSPIEHVSFSFAIEGISRACSHQLVRHRIASFSQQSQRYVKLDKFEYIIPPAIQDIPVAKDIFVAAMEKDQEDYNKLVSVLFSENFGKLVASGKNENEARRMAEKAAIEDARYALPNACETKMVVTMNARTLYNFFSHRCCDRAQWEIQKLAELMYDEVKQVAPATFSMAGPSCVAGNCPEGKMSCGKMLEKRLKYSKK